MSIITQDSPYTRFKSFPRIRRAFTHYNLLLHALDVSSIYLSDSRHVAPPKSGEEAYVTCGRCYLGGTTLNKPSLDFIYVIPTLWVPGGS